ncbi:MAG: glycosyltransferase family 2 protein [Nitrosomonadales bacterium]|nr:glycosyltransferase family 2 protein [Nitrosomonadales bacterium]
MRLISYRIASPVCKRRPILTGEAIIVNDGSTDDTRDVASKPREGAKITLRGAEKIVGLSGARNAGLAKSCGEFIQFWMQMT